MSEDPRATKAIFTLECSTTSRPPTRSTAVSLIAKNTKTGQRGAVRGTTCTAVGTCREAREVMRVSCDECPPPAGGIFSRSYKRCRVYSVALRARFTCLDCPILATNAPSTLHFHIFRMMPKVHTKGSHAFSFVCTCFTTSAPRTRRLALPALRAFVRKLCVVD